MKVKVKLFAVARQWADADEVELDLPDAATVADLSTTLLERVPKLATFGPQLRFAVNSDFANDAMSIPAGAEIACIPPVSGG